MNVFNKVLIIVFNIVFNIVLIVVFNIVFNIVLIFVSNFANATTTKMGKFNFKVLFLSTNFRKDSLASCLPLSIKLSSSSVFNFFLVLFLISYFISLYLFNSSMINLNLSLLIKLSNNALDT